jgi:hypothetical protein
MWLATGAGYFQLGHVARHLPDSAASAPDDLRSLAAVGVASARMPGSPVSNCREFWKLGSRSVRYL